MKKDKLTGLMVAFVTCCAVGAHAELPVPIAWWNMDSVKDGKIVDATGNGRDLTLGAGCSLTNDCMSGDAALFFNGTKSAWSNFQCPSLTARTYSMWVRRDAKSCGSVDPSENSYPFLLSDWSGVKTHFTYGNYASSTFYFGTKSVGSPNFRCGRWIHVVWTVESGADDQTAHCSFYIDNDCQGSVDTNWAELKIEKTAYLGNRGKDDVRPILGIVDDVRIYDRALSMAERLELYKEGVAKSPRLIGRWKMDSVVVDGNSKRTVPDETGWSTALALGSDCALTNGVNGGAVWFTGSEVSLSSAKNAFPFQVYDFTVSGWYNMSILAKTPVVAGNDYPRLWGTALASAQLSKDGKNLVYYGPWAGTSSANLAGFGWGSEIWSHFAVVVKIWWNDAVGQAETRTTVYRDGIKIGTIAERSNTTLSSIGEGSTYWMGSAGVANRTFTGAMDDFRIYAGAMTDAEVLALYKGTAAVNAGADFIVAESTAVLQGVIQPASSNGLSTGFEGNVNWELVSAPSGGADAVIQNPANAHTSVTLPVAGSYVFRLVSRGAMSDECADTVVVTRIAPIDNNISPTVSIAASAETSVKVPLALVANATDPDNAPGTLRTNWTKVSGPSAVAFERDIAGGERAIFYVAGSYVLRCTVTDGQDEMFSDMQVMVASDDPVESVEAGLLGYWRFEYPSPTTDAKSGTVGTLPTYPDANMTKGVSGRGIRVFDQAKYFDTGMTLQEEGTAGQAPTGQWRAFSLWMYHDAVMPNTAYESSLVSVGSTLGIRYNSQNSDNTFTLYQQGPGGNVCKATFKRPQVDPANRWTHLYVLVDRISASNNKSEVWADGVKLDKISGAINRTGRVRTDKVYIGGMYNVAKDENNGWYEDEDGNRLSRAFPGMVDEVRMYNRQLTEDEIRYLSMTKNPEDNHAPAVETDEAVSVYNRKVLSIPCVASDDGIPKGGSLTYVWTLDSGDADGIALSQTDKSTCVITGRKKGTYQLRVMVSDGERVTSSIVRVAVLPNGMVLLFR